MIGAEQQCSHGDCSKFVRARGMCVIHYSMWRRLEMLEVGSKLYSQFDEAAVAQAAEGHPVDLSKAEREGAVSQLHRQGLSDPQIAARIGCSERTVLRVRQRLELPPVGVSGRRSW